jgi:integration host factor subunit beta
MLTCNPSACASRAQTDNGAYGLNRQIVEPINRSELTNRLAEHSGHLPADQIEAAVRSILDRMVLSLQSGERIEIRGFGGFSLHHHEPRAGRNPKTGEAVQLPARYAIHFKPGKELRERVNASLA